MKHPLSTTPAALRVLRAAVPVTILALAVSAGLHAQPAKNAPASLGNTFVFSPPKGGQVLSIALREKLLALDARSLHRENPALEERLRTADNPFYRAQPPPPEPTADLTASTEPQAPAAVQISDADRLRIVAEQFNASGILQAGGRAYISISGNRQLVVGTAFKAGPFPGDTAQVTIEVTGATRSGYTLKLRDTSLLFPYAVKPASGRAPAIPDVMLSPPTPEPSPEPASDAPAPPAGP